MHTQFPKRNSNISIETYKRDPKLKPYQFYEPLGNPNQELQPKRIEEKD